MSRSNSLEFPRKGFGDPCEPARSFLTPRGAVLTLQLSRAQTGPSIPIVGVAPLSRLIDWTGVRLGSRSVCVSGFHLCVFVCSDVSVAASRPYPQVGSWEAQRTPYVLAELGGVPFLFALW
jgi:hypothetical protein